MSAYDEMADAREPDDSTPRFEVAPFQSDGGFPTARLEMLLGILIGLGIALGYGTSWLDHWVPELEWAWVGAGAAILALISWFATGWAQLRNGGIALLTGFVGGVTVPVAMMFWSHERRLSELEDDVRRLLPARIVLQIAGGQRKPFADKIMELEKRLPAGIVADLEPTIERHLRADPKKFLLLLQANIEQLEAHFQVVKFRIRGKKAEELPRALQGPAPDLGIELNAVIHEAVARLGYWEYLDWRAQQGMELRLPKIRSKINLGYTGTWIYWSIEALVAGLAVAITVYFRSTKPYCVACNTWMKERELGRLSLSADVAKSVFSTGAVVELATDTHAQPDGPLKIDVATCPNCAGEADIVVRLSEVTKKDKKKEETKELGQFNYPGQALQVLEALFPKVTVP